MHLLKRIPIPLIIFLVCIISRIPMLTSPLLMLDGDECVVALMAKHAYLGKELPVYFWGQTYGFSLIEVLAILPFYAVIGINTLAVKLAMLCLWSIGVIFLYKAMTAINDKHKMLALLLVLVLVLCPAWVNWSMKARGGYLTSFTLSSLTLYILFFKGRITEYARYLLAGVLICLVYESQPFWLIGVLPLLLYKFVTEKKIKYPLLVTIAATVTALVLSFCKSAIISVYAVRPPVPALAILKERILRFPGYVYKSLQGNYSFSWYQDTNSYYTSFAEIFTTLVFLIAVVGVLHLLFKRKGFWLFILSTAFVPLALGYSLLSETMEGRYLLPLTGFTLLAIFIYMRRLNLEIPVCLGAAYLVIAAAIATLIFPVRFVGRSHRQALEESLNYLEQHDIRYVYATDCMMPWEVMFYSDEKILGRMFYFPGRYPMYDTLVDRALYAGKKTAVIGYWKAYEGLELDTIDRETQYFISKYPTKATLEKVFHFPLTDTAAGRD